MNLSRLIRDVPDFPKKGILFKDITTLLADGEALRESVKVLSDPFRDRAIDKIACMESRGFIFGAPMAIELGTGMIPLRKPGKLPAETISAKYQLEYGTDSLEMHVDAVSEGERVLIVDDLLATGGTAAAAIELVEKRGGIVEAMVFLVELTFLNGRDLLDEREIYSHIKYGGE